MRRILFAAAVSVTSFMVPVCLQSQEAKDASAPTKAEEPATAFYHLEFIVRELDSSGKPVNSRSYSTSVSTDSRFHANVNTGSKIPIVTSSLSDASPDSGSKPNYQYQYSNVGTKFDIDQVTEKGHDLAMSLAAEVTSVASPEDSRIHQPVIRQNTWRAQVLLSIGKPVVVFRSESLDNKGAIEVVLTVTPAAKS